jgi:hypothetical protein
MLIKLCRLILNLGGASRSPCHITVELPCRHLSQPSGTSAGAAALTQDLWRIVARHMDLQDWVMASGTNRLMYTTPLDVVMIGEDDCCQTRQQPNLLHGALPCSQALMQVL